MIDNKKQIINRLLIRKEYREKENLLINLIPELIHMVGFDQNHPHHHLDVWHHTLLALDNLETDDLETNMALLLHDIGKPFSYQDEEIRHFYGHAEKSEEMSRNILKRLNYDDSFINNVCYLIKNHDTKIDVDNLYYLDLKLLDIQYADSKAHHPDKVRERVRNLNNIKKSLKRV